MFQSKNPYFNQVKDFHARMDGHTQESPRAYEMEEALHRADFKLEEIVEFLQATVTRESDWDGIIDKLHQDLDKAAEKVKKKGHSQDPLVGQVDALVDLLYFTYGSFALMGVDPEPIFQIVHKANMGKIFPDGKAHFHPVTHKILKPDDWEEKFAPEPAIRKELLAQLRARKE